MRRRPVEFLARGVVVISLALQSLAGICGPACTSAGVEVAPASIDDGSLHFRKGDREGDLPITDTLPAETASTSLRATMGSESPDQGMAAISFLFDDPSASVVHGYFDLQVQRQFEDEGIYILIATNDPRAWPVGEVPSAEVDAHVKVTSFESCDDDDCLICEADAPDATVRIFVDESTGAADESTNRVSDDFHRKMRIEVDLGGPIQPGSCADAIEASGGATFSWTSADFVWTDGC